MTHTRRDHRTHNVLASLDEPHAAEFVREQAVEITSGQP
jgi:hypothetical protein